MKISSLPFMYSLAGIWSFYVLSLSSATANAASVEAMEMEKVASNASANPMAKVVELLDFLSKEIAVEGNKDRDQYYEYKGYYDQEIVTTDKTIKEHAEKIDQLVTDLKEAEAFQEGKNLEFTELAEKQTKTSMQLDAARENRRKEREVFQSNEDKYTEALDQLRRSIIVLKKKTPEGYVATAGAASASLLSVAQGLRQTLLESSDVVLSAQQRQTLDDFVRTVGTQAVGRPAPSFLQHVLRGPYGEFEADSGGMLGTLQDLKVKVDKERTLARETERKAKSEFNELAGILSKTLEDIEKSVAAIKVAIAESKEESSRKTIDLMKSREIHKEAVEHRAKIEEVFRKKTSEYKNRLIKRSDEVIAVHEAQRMLSSEVAKRYIKMQKRSWQGTAPPAQMALMRKKALHVMKHATTPGMALLAWKASVHFKRGKDPFVKVKAMIKDLLKDMYEKQAKESSHASFCDREMSRTAINEKAKGEDLEKLNTRLEALTAQLGELATDIITNSKDLMEVEAATKTAVATREKEHKVADGAEREYKAAAKLVRGSITVLKKYYRNDKYQKAEDNNAFKQRRGLGRVVIGILEIAADDFDRQYKEAKQTENSDARDFQALHTESLVRTAVFKQELERDAGEKTALELEQTNIKNELKSKTKELRDIGVYLAKLKASCFFNKDDFARKKAKRDAELQSLNEVLTFLKA